MTEPSDALAAAAALPTVMAPALPHSLPTAADDGRADETLTGALDRWARAEVEDTTPHRSDVVRAFLAARVYIPAVAPSSVIGEASRDQLGMIALRREDGLTAVPVFTDIERLVAWRPDARPLPHSGASVAQIAQEEGYAVAVIDIDGPVTATLPIADLAPR